MLKAAPPKAKLAATREMLAEIEKRPALSTVARAASRRTLQAFANQLVEELRKYEAEQQIEPQTPLRDSVLSA